MFEVRCGGFVSYFLGASFFLFVFVLCLFLVVWFGFACLVGFFCFLFGFLGLIFFGRGLGFGFVEVFCWDFVILFLGFF